MDLIKSLKFRIRKYLIGSFQRKFVIPSYDEKRSIIRSYAVRYKAKTFIETGTLFGDTVMALVHDFEKLFSVELSEELANMAKIRFQNLEYVSIIHGDSARILNELLAPISEKCLFWLDGHYSSSFKHNGETIQTAKGETNTPIIKELGFILRHPIKDHVILIDDARCFGTTKDYPSMKELKKFVFAHNPALSVKVSRDIIRITNPNA
jgi:hypothetical protein